MRYATVGYYVSLIDPLGIMAYSIHFANIMERKRKLGYKIKENALMGKYEVDYSIHLLEQ